MAESTEIREASLGEIALMSVIAWAYVRFGSLPKTAGVLYAIKPALVCHREILGCVLGRAGSVRGAASRFDSY